MQEISDLSFNPPGSLLGVQSRTTDGRPGIVQLGGGWFVLMTHTLIQRLLSTNPHFRNATAPLGFSPDGVSRRSLPACIPGIRSTRDASLCLDHLRSCSFICKHANLSASAISAALVGPPRRVHHPSGLHRWERQRWREAGEHTRNHEAVWVIISKSIL